MAVREVNGRRAEQDLEGKESAMTIVVVRTNGLRRSRQPSTITASTMGATAIANSRCVHSQTEPPLSAQAGQPGSSFPGR